MLRDMRGSRIRPEKITRTLCSQKVGITRTSPLPPQEKGDHVEGKKKKESLDKKGCFLEENKRITTISIPGEYGKKSAAW